MPLKLFLIVKPGAKEDAVLKIDETHFRVKVKAPPDEGRANKAVIEVMADYLHLPKSCLEISSGHKSKNKTLIIFDQ